MKKEKTNEWFPRKKREGEWEVEVGHKIAPFCGVGENLESTRRKAGDHT